MADKPNLLERAGNWLAQRVASYLDPDRVVALTQNREYYAGRQRKPLKTKSGQYDDNLITNLVSLAVDRSTSMLFGGGVEFHVPEGDEHPKKIFLDETWKANKKQIFLHRWGMDGELSGTPYIKIIPQGLSFNGLLLPRLVLLDPALMDIITDPMDIDNVLQYTFEMKISDSEAYREVTRKSSGEEISIGDGLKATTQAGSWIIEKYKTSGRSSAWVMIGDPVIFPYPFPPILHIQNLPSIHSVYGVPGIDGLVELQDKYNFTVSNLLKIVRYHAHPKTWGRGLPSGTAVDKVTWGADEMIKISSDTGMIANLEMQSDLASSRNIAQDIRQSIFDLARVVDISSNTDKVGALTNFGLRVLYSDALAKNATRRALYGDGLIELNRRMLILNEMDGANDLTWGSDMPADEKEDAALILADLAAGIVSQETASEERGYTWKSTVNAQGVAVTGEEDKIKAEKQGSTNLENVALANLFAGRQVPQ